MKIKRILFYNKKKQLLKMILETSLKIKNKIVILKSIDEIYYLVFYIFLF